MVKFGHDVSFEQTRSQIGKGGDKLIPEFLSADEQKEHGKELEGCRSRACIPLVWRQHHKNGNARKRSWLVSDANQLTPPPNRRSRRAGHREEQTNAPHLRSSQ
jgi:hypothetical protein